MAALESGTGLGGAIGDFFGTLIGEALAQGDIETAKKLREAQRQRIQNVGLPELRELGDTAYANVNVDPRYGSVEDEVLRRLVEDSRTGMDAQDEADLIRARKEAQQQEMASRASLERLAQRRGVYNSGLTTAGQIAAQQGQANRLNTAGIEAAGQAAARRRQSLGAAGQYASLLAGRKLGVDTRAAGARDIIARQNQQLGQQRYENAYGQARDLNAIDQGDIEAAREAAERKRRLARGIGQVGGSVGGFALGGLF